MGLAGDLVDVAIPFVGGLGETAKATSTLFKAADNFDDVHDTVKAIASSLLYDVSYDLFSSGEIKATNLTTYAIDVTMDATLAPINYYYSGNLSNGYLRSAINGLVDGAIDVFQTIAYFTP